jgi:hypothetical protein
LVWFGFGVATAMVMMMSGKASVLSWFEMWARHSFFFFFLAIDTPGWMTWLELVVGWLVGWLVCDSSDWYCCYLDEGSI